jgi:hypothetical protein
MLMLILMNVLGFLGCVALFLVALYGPKDVYYDFFHKDK